MKCQGKGTRLCRILQVRPWQELGSSAESKQASCTKESQVWTLCGESPRKTSLLQSFPECTFLNRKQATDTSPLFYTFLRGCLPQPVHTWSLWGRLCREALPCALPRPSFPSTGIPLSGPSCKLSRLQHNSTSAALEDPALTCPPSPASETPRPRLPKSRLLPNRIGSTLIATPLTRPSNDSHAP